MLPHAGLENMLNKRHILIYQLLKIQKLKREKILFVKKLIKQKPRPKILAHAGLEPATFALLARRSNQLS